MPAEKIGRLTNVDCDQKRSVVPVKERSAPMESARETLSVCAVEEQTPLSSVRAVSFVFEGGGEGERGEGRGMRRGGEGEEKREFLYHVLMWRSAPRLGF